MLQALGGIQQSPPSTEASTHGCSWQAKPAENSARNTALLQTRPSLLQEKKVPVPRMMRSACAGASREPPRVLELASAKGFRASPMQCH